MVIKSTITVFFDGYKHEITSTKEFEGDLNEAKEEAKNQFKRLYNQSDAGTKMSYIQETDNGIAVITSCNGIAIDIVEVK